MGACFSSAAAGSAPSRNTGHRRGQQEEELPCRDNLLVQQDGDAHGAAAVRDYEKACALETGHACSPGLATPQSPEPKQEAGYEKLIVIKEYMEAQPQQNPDPQALEVILAYLEAVKQDVRAKQERLDRKSSKDTDAPRTEATAGQDKDRLVVQPQMNQNNQGDLQHALSGALAYLEDVKRDVQTKQETLDRKLSEDADAPSPRRRGGAPRKKKGKKPEKIVDPVLREFKDFTFGGLGLMLEVI